MSEQSLRRRRKFILYGATVLAAALAFLLVPLLGLRGSRLPPTARVTRGNARPADTSFEEALEALRKEPGPTSYRNAIARLNGNQSLASGGLTDAERRLLREQFQLDDRELAEVGSAAFTPLDAYHLDQCFLLHDAARALGVDDRPALERAVAAFDWAMRQVRLQEAESLAAPPSFVLRRGLGTDRERSLVFLALAEQLGLPGCMVVLPDGQGFRDWVPGVLADGQIYLFDTRLGLPLPSGRGVATLAQVHADSEWLKPLCAGHDLSYDVDFPQARRAEPRVACSLSALAPRMRRLQTRLEAAGGPRLATDPAARLEEFRNALVKAGLGETAVQVWVTSGQQLSALRALRSFLGPHEGGSDLPTDGVWRRQRFDDSLTPWQFLPRSVARLPGGSDLGPQLRQGFAKPFVDLAYDPRLPHELMLRGRSDDAVAGLVEMRNSVERLRESVRAQREPEQVLEKWIEEVRRAYAELLRAQRAAGGKETPALQAAQVQMNRLWEAEHAQRPLEILQAAAAEPQLAQATYYLALAKHEVAERAQASLDHQKEAPPTGAEEVKATWGTAADWWQKFLNDHPTDPAVAAARLNLARALAARGDRAAALQLLQEPPADFRPWEKRACKVRAHRLGTE